MKAVDGWIAVAGVVALALAAVVILRSREATRPRTDEPMPSATAPAPPESAFPACTREAKGMPRWKCQVAQARREKRLLCYGQRLYYIEHTPSGAKAYHPWPARLQCANTVESTAR